MPQVMLSRDVGFQPIDHHLPWILLAKQFLIIARTAALPLMESSQVVMAGASRDLLENDHVRQAYLGM